MPRGGATAGLVLSALCAVACGRAGYEPIDLSPRPTCDWRDGPPRFGPAVLLPDPISVATSSEIDPFVDARGNLWFASDRAGSYDLYVLRPAPDGGVGAPELASDLDLGPTVEDTSPHVLDDLGVAVHSAAPGGGSEGLYAATRDAASGTYGAPVRFEPGVGALQRHFDPFLAPDTVSSLLVLVWSPERASGGRQLYVATRPLDAPFAPDFGAVSALALGGDGDDTDPSLDVSLTTLVLTSTRGGATGLWYATRPTASGTFGAPQPLPDLVPGDDRDAFLAPDGCTMWLVGGDGDLYRVPIER